MRPCLAPMMRTCVRTLPCLTACFGADDSVLQVPGTSTLMVTYTHSRDPLTTQVLGLFVDVEPDH